MSVNELPAEYQVVAWENLWRYVGRVITGHAVPRTTLDVIADLRKSAKELRETATRLEAAATAMQASSTIPA